jgi:hypothetical protein
MLTGLPDFDYIEVTITGLRYDTGPAPVQGPNEGADLCGEQVRGHQ